MSEFLEQNVTCSFLLQLYYLLQKFNGFSLSPFLCVSVGLSLSPSSSPVTHCTHCHRKWVFLCWNSLPCALRGMTCTWAWLMQSWLWWVGKNISLTCMYIKAVVGFYLVHFVHSAVFHKLLFSKKARWLEKGLSNHHCCNVQLCVLFSWVFMHVPLQILQFLLSFHAF